MESKPAHTLKLLCSYGGKILPRPTDGQLRYVGGHTRVLAVDRSVSFSGSLLLRPIFPFPSLLYSSLTIPSFLVVLFSAELMVKLVELCGSSVTLRCQLPKGDLETLISITNDEDLANIFHEYDRASSELTHPLKIRAVLSPPRSMMIKKLSPVPSSSTSSASHSPFRSPHTSAESLPYAAVHRIVRQNRSPRAPLGFPIKACCYPGRFEGSPRFLYRGPHCSNYCH